MRKALRYRVTKPQTGEIIVEGNSHECAEKLFITVESFRATAYRHKHTEKYSTNRRGYNVEVIRE